MAHLPLKLNIRFREQVYQCAKEKKAIYLIGGLLLKTHMNSFLAIFHEFWTKNTSLERY